MKRPAAAAVGGYHPPGPQQMIRHPGDTPQRHIKRCGGGGGGAGAAAAAAAAVAAAGAAAAAAAAAAMQQQQQQQQRSSSKNSNICPKKPEEMKMQA